MFNMNGKVYKLTCESGKVYIGSTCTTLDERLQKHKSDNNDCTSKGFVNPTIELLEEIECENKDELRWKEREYIEKNETVNKQKPICNDKEKKDRAKRGAIIRHRRR